MNSNEKPKYDIELVELTPNAIALENEFAHVEDTGKGKTVNLVEGGANGKAGDKVDGALEEAFRVMGLSEEAAKAAARGRGDETSVGALEESFRTIGLSEEAAKVAARGRE